MKRRRPLRVIRRSLRRDGKNPSLPWVMRCGCGIRSQCATFDHALDRLRYHDCAEPL